MINRNKYAAEFSSPEKAEAFLIQTLEEEFAGREFEIYTREGNRYAFNHEDYGTSLYCYVKDQDGNVSNAGITVEGKLWTDYMASYYMPKVAQPIADLLNPFEFVKNYAITLDNWDENNEYNEMNWTAEEFLDKTRRVYRINIFLPEGEDKETYVEQAYAVYDRVYEGTTEAFDMEFYIDGKVYIQEAGRSGIEKIFSNRMHQSIHNHVGDFGKDPKTYFEEDLKPEHVNEDFYSNVFGDYGVVWKYAPTINEKDGTVTWEK